LSLKSLFSRSISDEPGLIGPSPSPRAARRKMMLVTLAALLAIVGAVASAYYFAMRPVTLRIAVGPANTDDIKVIQALTQAFAREHEHVRLRPIPSDGAAASAALIADGKADLAVIRGDLEVPKNALAVATLRKNVVVFWVPSASDITTISQVAGRRIGVIGRTAANVNLLKVILRQYGVDATSTDIVQYPPGEVAEVIRNQKADAVLATGPVNSKLIADAIAASVRDGGTPTFLAIDAAEAIAQNHPMYEAGEIPAGAFGGSPARPEADVKTIGFSHHIVAREGLSDSIVAAFTRQLFTARQSMMAEFPLSAKFETPDTDKGAVITVHPGAAAYVDGEEKSFLERYSDYIWFSLMGLSVLGSVGAWSASYWRREERGSTSTSTVRERLLEMLSLARKSNSLDELDGMQAEADDILRNTLRGFEQGAIDQGALTAFNIALEQFHNAVADRKALFATMPQHLQRTGAQLRVGGAV
jgi:TRAP transporter TAXI family solute receptor